MGKILSAFARFLERANPPNIKRYELHLNRQASKSLSDPIYHDSVGYFLDEARRLGRNPGGVVVADGYDTKDTVVVYLDTEKTNIGQIIQLYKEQGVSLELINNPK